jgi:hypothetical protein
MFRTVAAIVSGVLIIAAAGAGYVLLEHQIPGEWLLAYCVAAIIVAPVLTNMVWDWADRSPYR